MLTSFASTTEICETAMFPEKLGFAQNLHALCPPGETVPLPSFRIRAPKAFPAYMVGMLTYQTLHDARFKTFFCFEIAGIPKKEKVYGTIAHSEMYARPCNGLPRDT